MKKSLPIAKKPSVPPGGRMNPVPAGGQKMAKAPQPKKGSTTYSERSTRDAGPK